MNKKLFFGVASFLIIVAGGILIWQFWPELHSAFTSDKTNGWKTYTNNKFGYEVTYPSTWIVSGGNTEWSVGTYNWETNDICKISVLYSSATIFPEKFLEEDLRYPKTFIRIDGVDARRYTANPAREGLTDAIYLEKDGIAFEISRSRGIGTAIEQECINTFEQFITNFKFIQRDPSANDFNACEDSDGGKTYDIKGVVTLSDTEYIDYCITANHVAEYSCPDETTLTDNIVKLLVQMDIYSCPDGCRDGACIQGPLSGTIETPSK